MYFLLPHWVPATWRRRAQTSIRAELPSGKVPTTRVRLRISRFSRSMTLFVRIRVQCSEGKSQYPRLYAAYPVGALFHREGHRFFSIGRDRVRSYRTCIFPAEIFLARFVGKLQPGTHLIPYGSIVLSLQQAPFFALCPSGSVPFQHGFILL